MGAPPRPRPGGHSSLGGGGEGGATADQRPTCALNLALLSGDRPPLTVGTRARRGPGCQVPVAGGVGGAKRSRVSLPASDARAGGGGPSGVCALQQGLKRPPQYPQKSVQHARWPGGTRAAGRRSPRAGGSWGLSVRRGEAGKRGGGVSEAAAPHAHSQAPGPAASRAGGRETALPGEVSLGTGRFGYPRETSLCAQPWLGKLLLRQ